MGVKGLWDVVSPTGELVCLSSLAGQAVAVDLASWLVDTQSLQLGHFMTRPHLRNLFFRTTACLEAGVLPVMVLDGEAPSLKWNTIDARNNARNLGRSGNGGGATSTTAKSKRSRFNAVLKKCGKLFDLLGVPWVCAAGEAEATCAALNYHQVVEGVITQDSDVFLYGGNTVFRSFTASQKKATAEKYSMDLIEDRLHLTRGGMMLLAILLGCDYLPGGVHGVGRDTAVRFIKEVYAAGDQDPTQRLKQWAKEDIPTLSSTELASTKWKKGNTDILEDGLKKRLVATNGFPFTQLLAEFRRRLPQPLKKVLWAQPDFKGLMRWCVQMLDWEAPYALEKVAPVVTRWTVTQGAILRPLQPVRAVKQCVRRGVPSLRVEWQVSECSSLLPDAPQQVTTEEPLYLLRTSLPHLVQQFEDMILDAKKGKSKSKTKKAKEALKNKENICHSSNTITEYFKTVKPRSTAEAQDSVVRKASRIPSCKVKDARQLKEKGQVTKSTHDIMPIKENSRKDLQHHIQFKSETEEEEEEEEDVHSESDERELSLIIDRILNMDMNGGNKRPCITKKNKCETTGGFIAVQDFGCTSGEVSEAGEKTKNDESMKNIHFPQTPSLFERASKRLSQKTKKQIEILQNTTTTEEAKSKSVSAKNHISSTGIEAKIGTHIGNITEERVYGILEETLQFPTGVDLERKIGSHNVSTDMFGESLGEDTMARIFEDTMTEDTLTKIFEDTMAEDTLPKINEDPITEDTLAGMLQDTLALDSSLPNLNKVQSIKSNRMTGHTSDLAPKFVSHECDLHLPSVQPESHLHESVSSYLTSSMDHSPESKPNIHYLETDDSRGRSLEEHTSVKLVDNSLDHGDMHKTKQSNVPSRPIKSVHHEESVETEKQDGAPFSPSISSPVCKVSLERELRDMHVKLSYQSAGTENSCTHKQTSATPSSLSTPPVFKTSEGMELDDTSIELSSRFVHLEESHKKNQGNASLLASSCKAVGVSQKNLDSVGNTASPKHTAESWCSTNKYSIPVKKEETRQFRDLDGYFDGAHHESCKEGSVYEPLTGGSRYNTDAVNESIDVVINHKGSPQQTGEINSYQSYQACSTTQFCPNEGKIKNGNEMETPSDSPSSTSPSASPFGPGGRAWSLDPFSPEEVTLTLAQRLRQKCSDKQFRKLLDDLG